jgi:hypothetical protein
VGKERREPEGEFSYGAGFTMGFWKCFGAAAHADAAISGLTANPIVLLSPVFVLSLFLKTKDGDTILNALVRRSSDRTPYFLGCERIGLLPSTFIISHFLKKGDVSQIARMSQLA